MIQLCGLQILENLTPLLRLNHRAALHFSEVKGPVMDVIEKTDVIQKLTGKVFLSTQQAVKQLTQ